LGGKAILEALRNADLQVEPHSKWFRHNTPDQDWLPIVGEKKWIVLMRDKAIGKRYLELNALLRSKVKAFVLVTGELSEQVSAEIIKKAVPKIVEMIEQNDSHLSRRFIRIAQWNCGELKCSLSKGFN